VPLASEKKYRKEIAVFLRIAAGLFQSRPLALILCVVLPLGAHAEVWKCKEGDRTVFSDQPCPMTGKQLESRVLQGNVVQSEPVASDAPSQGYGVQQSADTRQQVSDDDYQPPRNVCPSDQEVKNLRTQASSISLTPAKKEFLNSEIRRAQQCAAGQGSYTASDQERLRDAQRAQNNIGSGRGARIDAEGVHSAADPNEGRRIAAENAARLARAQAEADRRAAMARDAAESTIASCDARGCYMVSGIHLYNKGGGTFAGPNGFCSRMGDRMQCP
jgi:hypothetical protein